MTLDAWTSLGGWWAAAVAVYLGIPALFAWWRDDQIDAPSRHAVTMIVILFGWIPLGIVVIVFQLAWERLFR